MMMKIAKHVLLYLLCLSSLMPIVWLMNLIGNILGSICFLVCAFAVGVFYFYAVKLKTPLRYFFLGAPMTGCISSIFSFVAVSIYYHNFLIAFDFNIAVGEASFKELAFIYLAISLAFNVLYLKYLFVVHCLNQLRPLQKPSH